MVDENTLIKTLPMEKAFSSFTLSGLSLSLLIRDQFPKPDLIGSFHVTFNT